MAPSRSTWTPTATAGCAYGTPVAGAFPEVWENGVMTIAFIRHGQTDWNAALKMQGTSDIPLNETGRQQARDAVNVLADAGWEVIVSSPLSRARETAQIVADGLGIALGRSYDLLVERAYGEGEGLTLAEIDARWPDRQYPGLEPLDSVVAREVEARLQVETARERVRAQ